MTSATTSATSAAAPAASNALNIARQAVLDAQGQPIGWELFNRSRSPEQHTSASDVQLLFAAMLHVGEQDLSSDLLLFINCTHDSLAGGHLELVAPERVVLEIEHNDAMSVQDIVARTPVLKALRDRGFKLCFAQGVLDPKYSTWLALAHFVRVNVMQTQPQNLPQIISRAIQHSRARVIAEKIETQQQFEMLRSLGASLFQGYHFGKPEVLSAHLLAPQPGSAQALLNLLRRSASSDAIEATIKSDLGLALNLLRLVNSTALCTAHRAMTIDQAVTGMGLKKLFNWAALLMAVSAYGIAPSAQANRHSVARARFMELLTGQGSQWTWVAGALSGLDNTLSVPMPRLLSLMHLPQAVAAALAGGEGALRTLLDLAHACAHNDEAAIAAHASSLKLPAAHVHATWQRAWAESAQPQH